jgi:hypothetical protein
MWFQRRDGDAIQGITRLMRRGRCLALSWLDANDAGILPTLTTLLDVPR